MPAREHPPILLLLLLLWAGAAVAHMHPASCFHPLTRTAPIARLSGPQAMRILTKKGLVGPLKDYIAVRHQGGWEVLQQG